MFCPPASMVSRTLVPVARVMTVTRAGHGSRRYFQLASGRKSSWFAVNAWLKMKSGIVELLLGIDAELVVVEVVSAHATPHAVATAGAPLVLLGLLPAVRADLGCPRSHATPS